MERTTVLGRGTVICAGLLFVFQCPAWAYPGSSKQLRMPPDLVGDLYEPNRLSLDEALEFVANKQRVWIKSSLPREQAYLRLTGMYLRVFQASTFRTFFRRAREADRLSVFLSEELAWSEKFLTDSSESVKKKLAAWDKEGSSGQLKKQRFLLYNLADCLEYQVRSSDPRDLAFLQKNQEVLLKIRNRLSTSSPLDLKGIGEMVKSETLAP